MLCRRNNSCHHPRERNVRIRRRSTRLDGVRVVGDEAGVTVPGRVASQQLSLGRCHRVPRIEGQVRMRYRIGLDGRDALPSVERAPV